jgi:hypothetical protein
LHHVDGVVVEYGACLAAGHLDDGFGVGTTPVLDRHDLTVGARNLIGTDTESGPQRTGERHEEPAGAAAGRCLLGDRGIRATIA